MIADRDRSSRFYEKMWDQLVGPLSRFAFPGIEERYGDCAFVRRSVYPHFSC